MSMLRGTRCVGQQLSCLLLKVRISKIFSFKRDILNIPADTVPIFVFFLYICLILFDIFAEGYTDTVSALLTAKEIDVTMQNGFGKTALALAAELNTKNHKAVVELLNNDGKRKEREHDVPNNKTKANYLEKKKQNKEKWWLQPFYFVFCIKSNQKYERRNSD